MATKRIEDLDGAELDAAVARALGWVDYPTDSVEQGAFWHCLPNRAPFGPRIAKTNWNPTGIPHQALNLIEEYGIATRKHSSNGLWYAVMQADAGDMARVHWTPMTYRNAGCPSHNHKGPRACYWIGRTLSEAAMRCFAGWFLGEEIDAELLI